MLYRWIAQSSRFFAVDFIKIFNIEVQRYSQISRIIDIITYVFNYNYFVKL